MWQHNCMRHCTMHGNNCTAQCVFHLGWIFVLLVVFLRRQESKKHLWGANKWYRCDRDTDIAHKELIVKREQKNIVGAPCQQMSTAFPLSSSHRHDICQKNYTTGVFGAKILPEKARKLRQKQIRQNSVNATKCQIYNTHMLQNNIHGKHTTIDTLFPLMKPYHISILYPLQ